jgi:hypothetical protein
MRNTEDFDCNAAIQPRPSLTQGRIAPHRLRSGALRRQAANQRRGQGRTGERLAEQLADAHSSSSLSERCCHVAAHHDDRDIPPFGSDRGDEFAARQAGHRLVRKQQVDPRAVATESSKSSVAGTERQRQISQFDDHVRCKVDEHRFVVHDHHDRSRIGLQLRQPLNGRLLRRHFAVPGRSTLACAKARTHAWNAQRPYRAPTCLLNEGAAVHECASIKSAALSANASWATVASLATNGR